MNKLLVAAGALAAITTLGHKERAREDVSKGLILWLKTNII